jgi:DivIVA domain-containing protein
MAQVLLLLVVALTVGAVVFGVMVLVSGGDPGLAGVEPDGRGRPLPGSRPLVEQDVAKVTFDLALRGYRMDQVDRALKRVAYDIGYKDELINVLSAEVDALRDGRDDDAEALRAARLAASASGSGEVAEPQLLDATVTEAGPSVDEPAVAQPAVAEPAVSQPAVVEAAFDDEVPDGPFAPWPPTVTTRASDSTEAEAGKPDEPDDPTDAPASAAEGSRHGDDADQVDRVVTRG